MKAQKPARYPLLTGGKVTFRWHGNQPIRLIGDFNGWRPDTALELAETAPGIRETSLELPADGYLEYIFLDEEGERILDPHNPRSLWNGVNGYNNFVEMPDYQPTPLTQRKRGVSKGTVTRHILAAEGMVSGGKREVYLYQPPTQDPCPLVVVWDGVDYLKRGFLDAIVDNLIAEKRIQPIALAMVQNHKANRSIEYGCCETTLGFLTEALIPFAKKQLNLVDPKMHPGTWGVLGASMGGLMAVYTGMRMPQCFGRVLSQSGAFDFGGYKPVVWDLARLTGQRPQKIWLDAGTLEWLHQPNLDFAAELKALGFETRLRIQNCGHNFTAWRNLVGEGLEYLYGMD